MDQGSILLLKGQAGNLPALNVSESATLSGTLIVQLTIPSDFSSYGYWENYTVVRCGRQCNGSFEKIIVEHDGACAKVEDQGEVVERDSLLMIAVKVELLPMCMAPGVLPPQLLLFVGLLLLFVAVVQ